MNKAFALGIVGMFAGIAGCATTASEPPVAGAGPCDAGATQELIGEPASQAVGATAMRLSGARALRWIPVDSAVTMDYRPSRLNIELDENSVVRTIRCG